MNSGSFFSINLEWGIQNLNTNWTDSFSVKSHFPFCFYDFEEVFNIKSTI